MERKCPQCKTWNASNNYCTKCNQPLDPQLIRELADNKREQENANKPLDRVDILHGKMKHSRFLIVRIFYTIIYSIWVSFVAIMSFFMWMTAAGPG
jgi:hypothetical protein